MPYSCHHFEVICLETLTAREPNIRALPRHSTNIRIAWKLAARTEKIASVRYRCLIPALHLKKFSVSSNFYACNDNINFLQRPDLVIFVKAFNDHDLALAKLAHQLNVPIAIDLCDNIFFKKDIVHNNDDGVDYNQRVCNFKEMAKLARFVVVTTPSLSEVVRREVGEFTNVVVIPDPLETPEDMPQMNLFQKKQMNEWLFGHGAFWFFWQGVPKLVEKVIREVCQFFISSQERLRQRLWRPLIHLVAKRVLDVQRLEAFQKSESVQNINIVEKPNRKVAKATGVREEFKLLWFGNAGSPGIYGITDLLAATDDLKKLAKEFPIHLRVISDSPVQFDKYIAPLPFKTSFGYWSQEGVLKELRSAKVVLVPNPMNEFAACKSTNRALLALTHGVPVVATKTSAFVGLEDCMFFDSWYENLKMYFTNPGRTKEHLFIAQDAIKKHFSAETIAEKWAHLLNNL